MPNFIVVESDPQFIQTKTDPTFIVVEPDELIIGDTLRGVPGPAGAPGAPGIAEEEMTYAKRVDFVGETVIYRGEAIVGAIDADATWRIRRITLAEDGDATEEWAAGSALFNQVWANRASLAYS
jgi:hypothetical protein